MDTMTRKARTVALLAALLVTGGAAFAGRGADQKKKDTSHTVQDCWMMHTIQDCFPDRVGRGTGGDDGIIDDWNISLGESGRKPSVENMEAVFSVALGVIQPTAKAPAPEKLFETGDQAVTKQQTSLLLGQARSTGSGQIGLDGAVIASGGSTGGGLVITSQAIPTPGAISLLGLGALALIGRRRRA